MATDKITKKTPLFEGRYMGTTYRAYEWENERMHYPCDNCPFKPCDTKPKHFPRCISTQNKYGKNLTWRAVPK